MNVIKAYFYEGLLLLRQFWNTYITKRYGVSEKGIGMYKYCMDIYFFDKQPETYAETIYEKELFDGIVEDNVPRKEVALATMRLLTPSLPPLTYLKLMKGTYKNDS